VEAAAADVRGELIELLKGGTDRFRAYIQADSGSIRLDSNKALQDSNDWSALFLCENGRVDFDLVDRCPRTWEAVQRAPLPKVAGWGPTAMFSLLKAGARIAPHTGMFNTRLTCHLPLIVPGGCRFRVGNEVREWQEGKLLIFDDTIEHEAWNDGGEDRVILIFDIWRPELSERERHELSLLFRNEG
jgi:aspartyl/asparaginyl beta-hydroxylase (cupin superfamily)